MRTAGTFSFRYGRIEVKAKLPKGDWYEQRAEKRWKKSVFCVRAVFFALAVYVCGGDVDVVSTFYSHSGPLRLCSKQVR